MSIEKYITGSCTLSNGVVHKDGAHVFENKNADLAGFLISIYLHFQFHYPKFYKMDNLCKLGWLTAEIMLSRFSHDLKDMYHPENVGIVLANANSSLDNDINYLETTKEIPSPSLFVYTLPNIVIGEICIRNNFKGEQSFFIQDVFDAGFMETQVNYLLDKNILQACICGWVDVLEQEYKAVLYLIEKKKGGQGLSFSAENMNNIFFEKQY